MDLNFPTSSGSAHNARGLKYRNDTLYVCFDRGGLRVVDVTNKTNPLEVYKYINNSLNSHFLPINMCKILGIFQSNERFL